MNISIYLGFGTTYINPGTLNVILFRRSYCEMQIRLENGKHTPYEGERAQSVSSHHEEENARINIPSERRQAFWRPCKSFDPRVFGPK